MRGCGPFEVTATRGWFRSAVGAVAGVTAGVGGNEVPTGTAGEAEAAGFGKASEVWGAAEVEFPAGVGAFAEARTTA